MRHPAMLEGAPQTIKIDVSCSYAGNGMIAFLSLISHGLIECGC
jgi:hypothetical protein